MLNKAYLIIDDLKLVIKDYSMRISKDVDFNNKYPSKKGQHRGFQLTVEAPQNNFLWEEAIKSYSMTPLMQIRFEPAIIGSEKTRIINMYDCHIVYHSVHYNHKSNEPLTESILIRCGGVDDSWYPGTVYSEHWRVTYPNKEETTVDNNDEPKLINKFITDLNNVTIDDYNTGDKILLNIETINTIGKTITFNLNDKTHDFKYNGVVLENDILKNYLINSNMEQVELEVIDQEN